MKSVLITFDQAYYDVVALRTLRKCRDVVRKQAIRISEAMPGQVCARLS